MNKAALRHPTLTLQMRKTLVARKQFLLIYCRLSLRTSFGNVQNNYSESQNKKIKRLTLNGHHPGFARPHGPYY